MSTEVFGWLLLALTGATWVGLQVSDLFRRRPGGRPAGPFRRH